MAGEDNSAAAGVPPRKRAFFQCPGAGWWIIIVFGMSLNYVCGFHPHLIPYDSFSFIGSFLKAVSAYSLTVKLIFIVAVLVHVGEAMVSWHLASKLNLRTADKVKWWLQSFVLGFPSLGILVRERRKALRKM